MRISTAARDMIVHFEVTSREYYNRRYRRPEWPGEASGVTIGIGYDVGYATRKQLWDDWRGEIPDHMVRKLEMAVGVTGQRARAIVGRYQDVDVPWDPAVRVFERTVLPRWEDKVLQLDGADRLNPHQLGALVSLTYNRGFSYGGIGDRYREMNWIRRDLAKGVTRNVPGYILSMKRLWTNTGLRRRRDAEAEMFARPWTEHEAPEDI